MNFHFPKFLLGLLSTVLLFLTVNLSAQAPSTGIFFQAVARDNFSNPAKDRKIYVQSSIIQSTTTGAVVLSEVHEATTDATGIFSISIGQGSRVGGTVANLTAVPWANGPFYLNLKIAITPTAPIPNWDYTKDWIDLGTTPFGTVPYALYSGSSGALDTKLNIADTSKMLALYARAQVVQSLSTAVSSKISTTDTAAMLAPYKKVVNELVASNITSLTASAINSALDSKVSLIDSGLVYVTPSQLKSKTFDSTSIYNNLALKELTSNRSISITTDSASDTKYPSVKSVKSYVDTQIAGATIADADANTKGKLQLAGDLSGTAAAPTIAANAVTTSKIKDANITTPKINDAAITEAKINDAAITTSKIKDANVTDAKILSVSGSKVTGDIAGNATTATKLAATKNINGVPFDGSADITIAANSNTLTGTTLASNVVNSSLTGVGTITSGTWNGNTIDIAHGGTGATTATSALTNLGAEEVSNKSISVVTDAASDTKYPSVKSVKDYVDGQLASGGVADGSITNAKLANNSTILGSTSMSLGGTYTSVTGLSSVSATNFTGTLSGNASTATALATARTISTTGDLTYTSGGFDGTNNVTGVATLANSGVLSGTYGSSTAIPSLTIDSKGRITNATTTSIIAGVNTVNSIAGTSNSNGATISGTTITLTPADANNGGVVTTGAQTIAGNKTFNNPITFNKDATINGLTIGLGIGNNSNPSNTVFGKTALSSNTNSEHNVAIGFETLKSNTTSNYNTAVGSYALSANNNADANVGIGVYALYQSQNGGYNTAVGSNSLASNISGNLNTAVGNTSLYTNTSGSYNTSIGNESLKSNTTGSNNTAIGNGADVGSSALTNATAIGSGAIVNGSNTIQLGNSSVAAINTNGVITAAGFNGPVTGNAATATKLAATKNINGVAFDGSADITIAANSNTLTGTTLASNIVSSSLTGVGTITIGTWNGSAIDIAHGGTGAITATNALTNLGAEAFSNKSTSVTTDAASDTKYPSVKSVKDYIDGQLASGGVADGSITNAKLAGSITASKLVGTDITTVGTITAGTWSASVIDITHGGTGSSTVTGAKTNLGLNNVENTALSTWAGSTNITSVGNISAIAKSFMFQDLTLGYGTPNGAKIQTDASNKYISFMPAIGVESTRLWPSGNVTIQHAGTFTDNGYTLEVGGTSNFIGNSSITGNLNVTGNITGATWSGTAIANNKLANSALTIGTTNIALGATTSSLAGLITVTATNLVGNVTGDVTGNLTGNAGTASKLASTKNINGVAFDGSADITIAANSNTLTGTTLASNVVNSSLTSVGTITSGVWSGTAIANNKLANSALTIGSTNIALGATTSSLAGLSTVTATNLVGNVTGDVTGNLTGNAGTATKLVATKNINGVAFDGSADITIAANSNTLTGTTLASNVVNSSLTGVGTITSGNWNGTTIPVAYGGTGVTSSTGTGNAVLSNSPTLVSPILGAASATSVNGLTIGRGAANLAGNIVFGETIFASNTTGQNNTAIGNSAMQYNTTGWSNTSIGNGALNKNSTGNNSTAVGYQSLFNNTASNNDAFGYQALLNNAGGNGNVSIGQSSLKENLGGNGNTVVGFSALAKNSAGSNNITMGYYAGQTIADGTTSLTGIDNSIILGSNAKAKGNGETNEIVIGYGAIGAGSNTIQLGNTAITNVITSGTISATGYTGTWNGTTIAVANGGTGSTIKNFVDLSTTQTIAGAKTYSSDLIVNGIKIGRGIGNDGQNTALGNNALGTGTGTRNTGVGYNALGNYTGTSFDNNTAVGYSNSNSVTTGQQNTAIGAETLMALTIANGNTAIGAQTLMSATGANNTALGQSSGNAITSGTNNTFVGQGANANAATRTNATAIGYGATVNADNTIQLGNTSVISVITSGTISATGFTGALTGNASTATKLVATKNINGVPFDGSGDITIIADAGTLTGTTLKSTITGSSLTTVGTITSGTWNGTTVDVAHGGTGVTSSTGTTNVVLSNSPTLVTPTLGAATATSINKVAISTPNSAATLSLADGSTLATSGAYTTTLTSSATTNITLPTTGTLATLAGAESLSNKTFVTPALGTPSSGILTNVTGLPLSTGVTGTLLVANGGTGTTTSTGSGSVVLSTSPTLVTPILGTPTSATLTNATGLPITTGVSGLGTGIASFLATPTSANLNTAVSDETGSGALVFATSPTLTTPNIGIAMGTSLSLTGNLSASAGTFSTTLGVTGNTTLSSALSVSGATSLNTLTASGTSTLTTANITTANIGTSTVSGNESVAGTLGVTGNTTLTNVTASGTVTLTGNLAITNSSKGVGKVLTSDANGLATWKTTGGTLTTTAASKTINSTDDINYIIFTGSTAGQTITLPSATTVLSGKEYTFKNLATVSVTISTSISQTLQQENAVQTTSATLGVDASNNWIKVVSDGTNWIVFRALF